MNDYLLCDHPIIRNIEATGYPDGQEPICPKCPVCGAETDIVIKDIYGEIVGCDECLKRIDAWEADLNE